MNSNIGLSHFDRFSDNRTVGLRKDNRPAGFGRMDSRKTLQQRTMAKTTQFSAAGDRKDRPLLAPMRQISQSIMSCVRENSNSDLSVSARFRLGEEDEPIHVPMRQISNRLLELSIRTNSISDLSKFSNHSSNDRDLKFSNHSSNDRQFNQSLNSLFEDSIDDSFRSVGVDHSFRSIAAGQKRLETIVD